MIPWNSVQTSKQRPRFPPARPPSLAVYARRLRGRCARGAGRRECGLVVREIVYFLDILDMTNPVVRIQHENRPAFKAQFLDQRSVIRAEGPIFVVGEHPTTKMGPSALITER